MNRLRVLVFSSMTHQQISKATIVFKFITNEYEYTEKIFKSCLKMYLSRLKCIKNVLKVI